MLSAPTGSVSLTLVESLRIPLEWRWHHGGVSSNRMRGGKVAFSLCFLEESLQWS